VWEPPNFAALGGIDLATTDNFAEVISVKVRWWAKAVF
jgi:hypothetical protein